MRFQKTKPSKKLSGYKPTRIISLLASGTEIVCALGEGEELVGRSHECDNPPWVKRLPACSRPAFDIEMTSGEIDAEVRRRIEAGEPLYHIDTELIDRLRPDVLITQEHCEVCAVTAKDLDRDACAYAGRTVSLQASTLQEILSGIEAIGAAIECDASAARLVEDVKGRIAAVRAAVADRKPPTVVILEWIDPIFTSGNWVPELVEAANGRLLLGEPGQYSATQTWEAVQAADP
ncbi:MAG TPA: ABC transporter substrate-binding protein, partial [Candidatus Eremiobacteraceae bacterium]|nr:ABC transporter substrate-binding protein [Candidatus Eremiobacteraceae bacterium]